MVNVLIPWVTPWLLKTRRVTTTKMRITRSTLLTRTPIIQENRLCFSCVSDRAPLDGVCISRVPCSWLVDQTHASFIHDALPSAHQQHIVSPLVPQRAWFVLAWWIRRSYRDQSASMARCHPQRMATFPPRQPFPRLALRPSSSVRVSAKVWLPLLREMPERCFLVQAKVPRLRPSCVIGSF